MVRGIINCLDEMRITYLLSDRYFMRDSWTTQYICRSILTIRVMLHLSRLRKEEVPRSREEKDMMSLRISRKRLSIRPDAKTRSSGRFS
jgi:hypothetical protein